MDSTQTPETFINVRHAAVRLGVPATWLKREALAGRIPYLMAGRTILINPELCKAALLNRAQEGTVQNAH